METINELELNLYGDEAFIGRTVSCPVLGESPGGTPLAGDAGSWAVQRAELEAQVAELTDAVTQLTEALERQDAETNELRSQLDRQVASADGPIVGELREELFQEAAKTSRYKSASAASANEAEQLRTEAMRHETQILGLSEALSASEDRSRALEAESMRFIEGRRNLEEASSRASRAEEQLLVARGEAGNLRRALEARAASGTAPGASHTASAQMQHSNNSSTPRGTPRGSPESSDPELGATASDAIGKHRRGIQPRRASFACLGLDDVLLRVSGAMVSHAGARFATFGLWLACHVFCVVTLLRTYVF